MKHMHYSDVEAEIPDVDGAVDVTIRWLITKKDGAKNFTMRLFEVQPGGHTPSHAHEWEHEVFIVKGSGNLRTPEKAHPFRQGDFLFVEPMETHQFVNTGDDILQFICVIPYSD